MKITHYKDYRNRLTREYHVSYIYSYFDGSNGFGYIELTLKGRFDINQVAEYIKSTEPRFKNIVILSWQNKMK